MFLLWKIGPQRDPLPNVRYNFSVYITRMEGREDIVWLYDDITKAGDGTTTVGKRKLIRGGGGGVHPPDQQCDTTPRSRWRGGTLKYPGPQNSMTTGGDVRKNMVNHQYGGPVQTLSRGTGRFKREYVEKKQRQWLWARPHRVGRYVRRDGVRQKLKTDV